MHTNRAALQVLGLSGEEPPEACSAALAAVDAAGDEWSEGEWIGDDGQRRIVARRRSAVSAAPGRPRGRDLGSVEILDDRTQLAELSERLHALDKLAALGDMAGGIAHEVRNPLMAVQGFAGLLAARLERDSDEQRWAALIVEGADEANQILTSMLSLAKPDELVLSTVEPDELVRAAERLSAPDDGQRRWTISSTSDCPPFVGDRIKLRQALRNLIANALQAQPDGGAVAIEVRRDAGDVLVRVSDAGPGFAREVRRRALEPFFTTRAEGTGLGLALVQRIAEVHGGRVEIRPENSVLGGAEVSLRIPFRSPLN